MKPVLKKIDRSKSKGLVKRTDKFKSEKRLATTLKEHLPLKGILKKPSNVQEKEKVKSRHPKAENPFTKIDDSEVPDIQKGFNRVKKVRSEKKTNDSKRIYTKKERRASRLKSKKHGDIVPNLLSKWEILRREDTDVAKKQDLIDQMLSIGKDKLLDLSRARDTSRIIESMVQFGTEVQRWAIFKEVKDRLFYLCMSQYAKFVILKLIVYGAKEHRLEFFKAFRGHIVKLLRHKHAAEVLELLYNDYATAPQRAMILQEIYGHHIALQLTTNNVQRLEEAIALNVDKKLSILANVNNLLVTMVSKGLLRLSLVQHLLLEYLTELLKSPDTLQLSLKASGGASAKLVLDEHEKTAEEKNADEEDNEEGLRRSDRLDTLIETILEVGIVSMLHTREGVRAALAVLWICPPKDRKTLVKSLKTCVTSLACDEHGHLFLMGLLDAVDDTKLLSKTIIKELLEDLDDIVSHPHARKVLLYALTPRDPRHFPAQLIQSVIAPGDESPFTRKPLVLRALELRAPLIGLLPALLELASKRLVEMFVGDADLFPVPLEDRSRLVLLAEIISTSSADKLQLSTAQALFKRSGQREVDRSRGITSPLNATDLSELFTMRQAALAKLVEVCLVPEFLPVGLPNSKPKTIICEKSVGRTAEAKRNLQQERRKRALLIAETESIKKRKVSVKAFTNTDEGEQVAADDSTTPMEISTHDAPFLERAEGQLLIKRLLQEEKDTGAHELGRMIMESVPEENFLAWLTCNRSCFTLVNLFELGDPDISKRLVSILSKSLPLLNASTLPGAKILLKVISSSSY